MTQNLGDQMGQAMNIALLSTSSVVQAQPCSTCAIIPPIFANFRDPDHFSSELINQKAVWVTAQENIEFVAAAEADYQDRDPTSTETARVWWDRTKNEG